MMENVDIPGIDLNPQVPDVPDVPAIETGPPLDSDIDDHVQFVNGSYVKSIGDHLNYVQPKK